MSLTPSLFTSARSDGPNAALLQPSYWNNVTGLLNRLLGTAGATGALLQRDSSDVNGASWTSTPTLSGVSTPAATAFTMSLGAGYQLAQTFTDSTGLSARMHSIADPSWAAAGVGAFDLIYARQVNTNPSATQDDRAFSWGYNTLRSVTSQHSGAWTVENYYWPIVNALPQLESYFQYTTPDGLTSMRPIASYITIANGPITSNNEFRGTTHYFNSPTGTAFAQLDSTGWLTTLGHSIGTNNVAALSQKNAAGDAYQSLLSLNASNVAVVGTTGGLKVTNAFAVNSGITGVLVATAGAVGASDTLTTVSSITAPASTDLSLIGGPTTGAVVCQSSSNGGATLFVNAAAAATRGPGVKFNKNGSFTGYVGSDGQYLGSTAANFMIGANAHLDFYSGFAGAPAARLTSTGNFGLDTTTFGTNAVGVLGIGNGTEPASSPADMVQIYSVDLSAGNATLGLRTETAVVSESVVSDRTLSIRINGTTYKLCLKV